MRGHRFSIQQRRPGGACTIVYCYLNITKRLPAGTNNKTEAQAKARKDEPEVLKEIALEAALQGRGPACLKAAPDAESSQPGLQCAQKVEVPPLDESKPAPAGSLRAWVDERVAWLLSHGEAKTKSAKDRVKRARKNIFEGLGALVNKLKREIGVIEGELMVRYFNDPIAFPKCGPAYVTAVKYLLEPLIRKSELSESFYECLSRVEQQSKESECTDPFLKPHFRIMRQRLNTGLEQDYLLGLYLLGGAAGPQIIEPALLQWASVDFVTNKIRFFRQKTVVLAEFSMTPELRAWLERRRKAAAPDDVYVFWELVFLDKEIATGVFNKVEIPDNTRSRSVGTAANVAWRGFLHRSGIPVNYSILFPGDITDLPGFVTKLRTGSDPLSAWLLEQFNKKGQNAILVSGYGAVPDLEAIVIRNLNTILKEIYIFDGKRCEHVRLRPATEGLLHPKLKDERLHRANRLVLEDAYPELRHADFTQLNYAYSSFRKHYVSFVRSVGFPDEFCLRTCGHDALSSQGHYSSVAEHVLDRGAEVMARHIKAMEEDLPEFYPTTPLDFYEGVEGMLKKSDEKHEQRFQELRAELELLNQRYEQSRVSEEGWKLRYEEAQAREEMWRKRLEESKANGRQETLELAQHIAKAIIAQMSASGVGF